MTMHDIVRMHTSAECGRGIMGSTGGYPYACDTLPAHTTMHTMNAQHDGQNGHGLVQTSEPELVGVPSNFNNSIKVIE